MNAAAIGVQSLSTGMNKLDSAGGQLTSGIDKLATGSDTLTEGLKHLIMTESVNFLILQEMILTV